MRSILLAAGVGVAGAALALGASGALATIPGPPPAHVAPPPGGGCLVYNPATLTWEGCIPPSGPAYSYTPQGLFQTWYGVAPASSAPVYP